MELWKMQQWLALLVVFVVGLVIGQEETTEERGEPFTLASLNPVGLEAAIDAVKQKLLDEFKEIGRDAAEDAGVLEIADAANETLANVLDELKTKFEKFQDYMMNETNVNKIVKLVSVATNNMEALMGSVSSYCSASQESTLRMLESSGGISNLTTEEEESVNDAGNDLSGIFGDDATNSPTMIPTEPSRSPSRAPTGVPTNTPSESPTSLAPTTSPTTTCARKAGDYEALFPSAPQVSLGLNLGLNVLGWIDTGSASVSGGFGVGLDFPLNGAIVKGPYVSFGGFFSLARSRCISGKYCVNDVEHPCPEGYWCGPGVTSDPTGLALAKKPLCAEGYYCPQGSTSNRGYPYVDAGGCKKLTACKCATAQKYCPAGSTTNDGRSVVVDKHPSTGDVLLGSGLEGNCPAGYFCSGDGKKTKCPEGSYCPSGRTTALPCNTPGKYCPPYSTTAEGKPLEDHVDTDSEIANTVICAKGQVCTCPKGYKCTGDGKRDVCDAGYFCDGGQSDLASLKDCTKGYFCPPGSTTGTGKPLKTSTTNGACAANDDCLCGEGFYCPAASSTSKGNPKTSPAPCVECKCKAGYWCPKSSQEETGNPIVSQTVNSKTCNGVPCLCEAGYYCPENSKSPRGVTAEANAQEKTCEAPNYCPAGSQRSTGWPVAKVGTCEKDNVCACDPGHFCPNGSTDATGKPLNTVTEPADCVEKAACECPKGYLCDDGVLSECPKGRVCGQKQLSKESSLPFCGAGYFCPKTSTTTKGNPILGCDSLNAPQDPAATSNECKCQSGYWCPEGSTTKSGERISSAPSIPVDHGVCGTDAKCYCLQGFYCPEASTTNKGIVGAGLESKCQEKYFCPEGSSDKTGIPVKLSSGKFNGCLADKPCPCVAGSYCPENQAGGIRCPAGYYCPASSGDLPTLDKCKSGHFCPETSTSDEGQPADSLECTICSCKDGYYCPAGSTKETGNPVSGCTGVAPNPANVGDEANQCKCAPGAFCPVRSTADTGKPRTSTSSCPTGCLAPANGICGVCACPTGYYCEEKTGALTKTNKKCSAGYYCDGGSTTPTQKECAQGYWCPEGSQEETGKPVDLVADPVASCYAGKNCPCAKGYFCPPKSTKPSGYPDSTTGYCPKAACKCKAGHYCLENSIDETGNTIAPTSTPKFCVEKYYCPESSTSEFGQPAVGNCDIANDNKCPCSAGYFCPDRSSAGTGKPVPLNGVCPDGCGAVSSGVCGNCQCREGNFCAEGENEERCPKGHFCAAGVSAGSVCTDLGYFCPPGSTNAQGNPLDATSHCGVGQGTMGTGNCVCGKGFYCPSGSTTHQGEPFADSGDCVAEKPCPCSPGYYCPASSKSGKGTPADGLIFGGADCATNQECICKAGYYCGLASSTGDSTTHQCFAGYYCPRGSKNGVGESILANLKCQDLTGTDTKCYCSKGYYCPRGSQESHGNPLTNVGCTGPSGECYCAQGFFCPRGSTSSTGKSVVDGCPELSAECKCSGECPAGSYDSAGNHVPTSVRILLAMSGPTPNSEKPVFANVQPDQLQPKPHIVRKGSISLSDVNRDILSLNEEEFSRKSLLSDSNLETSGHSGSSSNNKWKPDEGTRFQHRRRLGVEERNYVNLNHMADIWANMESATNSFGRGLMTETVVIIDGDVEQVAPTKQQEKQQQRRLTTKLTSSNRRELSAFVDWVDKLSEATVSITIWWRQAKEFSGFGGWEVGLVRDNTILSGVTLIFNGGNLECKDSNDNRRASGGDFFLNDAGKLETMGIKFEFDLKTLARRISGDQIASSLRSGWGQRFPIDGFSLGAGGGTSSLFFTDSNCNPFLNKDAVGSCPTRRRRALRSEGRGQPRVVSRPFNNERKLIGSGKFVQEFLGFAEAIVDKGPIDKSFCFGECDSGDVGRYIGGTIQIKSTPECDGVSLIGRSPLISAVALIFVVLREIDATFASTVATLLGPLAELGIADAGVLLAVQAGPKLTFEIEGSPSLPSGDSIPDGFGKIFFNLFKQAEHLNFRVKVYMDGLDYFLFQISVNMDPITFSDDVAMIAPPTALSSYGPEIYSRTEVTGGFKAPVPVIGFGMNLPLRIRVDKDTNSYIYLVGNVNTEVTPAGPRLGGSLSMVNKWRDTFGLNFVHIGDAIVETSFNPVTFPIPASMKFGAGICLGNGDKCTCVGESCPSKDGTVELVAYVSYDLNVPAENYFVALTRGLTVGNIIQVFGESEPTSKIGSFLLQLNGKLPSFIKDTGIYPFDETKCTNRRRLSGESGRRALSQSPGQELDKNCYAMISFAPLAPVPDVIPSTDAVEVSLEQGLSLQGRLQLLNLVNVSADLVFDVFSSSGMTIKTNVSVDKEIELFIPSVSTPFISIGERVENFRAVGGAQFYFFASTSQAAFQADISGAIAFPFLKSYGVVDLTIDDDGADFFTELKIFDGVINPLVDVRWKWDLSEFYFHIERIPFSPALVIDELTVAASTAPGDVEFLFDADITVLFFAKIEGFFWVKQEAEDINVRFRVSGDTGLAKATVSGSAVVDTKRIEDSDFGDFSVSLQPGALAVAVGEAAEKAVAAVKEGVTKALDAGKKLIGNIVDSIKNLGAKLSFIKDAFTEAGKNFEDALNDLKNLDLEGFAENLFAGFETIFDPNLWGKAAITTLDAFGLISTTTSDPYNKGTKDKWGCYWQYVKVKTYLKTRICVFGVCTPNTKLKEEEKGPFQDEDCVNKAKAVLQDVENKLDEAGQVGSARDETKNGNKGLLKFDGKIPASSAPDLNDIADIPVPSGNSFSNVAFSGKTPKLSTSDSGGAFTSGKVAYDSTAAIDFSNAANFDKSMQDAAAALGNRVRDKMTADQKLVSDSLAQKVTVQQRVPLEITFPQAIKTVSCTQVNSALALRPVATSYDATCTIRYIMNSWSKRPSSDPQHPCGTTVLERNWVAVNNCGQTSNTVVQRITILNEKPKFSFTPADESIDTNDDLFDLSLRGEAIGYGICENTAVVEFTDGPLTKSTDNLGCGSWTMARTWTVRNMIDGPTCRSSAVSYVQTFTIEDTSPPSFVTEIPSVVRIPFFVNYDARFPPPIVTDIPGNAFFANEGLDSGALTLVSSDTDLTLYGFEDSDKAQCRVNGLGYYDRTWTATDACGNKRTATQRIIIEHPPTDPIKPATQGIFENGFAFSVGVSQLVDPCAPGKLVRTGMRDYKVNGGMITELHDCLPGSWQEDGCRVISELSMMKNTNVFAVKPKFTSIPDDIQIYTNESAYPENTGFAYGEAFCDTPYEIIYIDDDPIPDPVDCGVWTIARNWVIRPVYKDCKDGVPLEYDHLVTIVVQTITVVDMFAPEFIQEVAPYVMVEFLTNYGPDATGIPQVEDIVYHPSLWIYSLDFHSYPIDLRYDDTVVFTESAQDLKTEELATVTRVWTTNDRCGYTRTLTQAINIQRAQSPMFGDVTKFQLFGNNVGLKDSTISQDIASGGDKVQFHNAVVQTGQCATNNLLLYSLVLENCASQGKFSVVKDRSVQYGQTYTGSGKKRKVAKCNSLSSLNIENGRLVGEDKPQLSVNFDQSNIAITSGSMYLRDSIPDLLTGPVLITCTEPAQSSCEMKTDSANPQSNKPVPNVNDGHLVLRGDQPVYNLFTVAINDWFYSTSEYSTERNVDIQASGFVLVNVVDDVVVAPDSEYPGNLTVTRFDQTFKCAYGTITPSSLPIFGNYQDGSGDLYNFDTRNMVSTNNVALSPSSHLLVNIVTKADHQHPVALSTAEVCTGLRYRFNKEMHERAVLAGSYIISNPSSSLTMWNYQWNGGQLVGNGQFIDLRDVTMNCDIFFPHVAGENQLKFTFEEENTSTNVVGDGSSTYSSQGTIAVAISAVAFFLIAAAVFIKVRVEKRQLNENNGPSRDIQMVTMNPLHRQQSASVDDAI